MFTEAEITKLAIYYGIARQDIKDCLQIYFSMQRYPYLERRQKVHNLLSNRGYTKRSTNKRSTN